MIAQIERFGRHPCAHRVLAGLMDALPPTSYMCEHEDDEEMTLGEMTRDEIMRSLALLKEQRR